MYGSVRIFIGVLSSIFFLYQVSPAQSLTWKDPSKLLGSTYDQFRQAFPGICKKLKNDKNNSDLSTCFINGHVDSFLTVTNGATLTFNRGELKSIEFSVWRGTGTPDSLIVRYGPYDNPDLVQAGGNLQSIGKSGARKYFWTKDGYGIVWEQYFRKSFSDALAFNADTERIWFVATDRTPSK